MSDGEREHIETEGSARWRADAERTMGKLHDRLTRAELRVSEALGTGSDDGRIGKELDSLRGDVKAIAAEAKRTSRNIAFAIAAAVGGLGTGATAIWNKGSESGATLSRLSTLERDVDKIEASIRSLWTITAPRPFSAPPTE